MVTCWIRDFVMTRSKAILFISLAVSFLGACEMYAPPSVNERRVEVHEQKVTQQIPVASLDDDSIAGIAHSYGQSGMGVMEVTVTYDPTSHNNTAMRAGDEAVRIARILREEGVTNVATNVLPVREQGSDALAIISYTSYQASAPSGCGELPGMTNPAIDHDPDYKLGCTVETVFAKQVADPSDLLGNAKASAYTDGRVLANQVESYRTGAPNEPLEGQSASED